MVNNFLAKAWSVLGTKKGAIQTRPENTGSE
jgi:hypothetical protein